MRNCQKLLQAALHFDKFSMINAYSDICFPLFAAKSFLRRMEGESSAVASAAAAASAEASSSATTSTHDEMMTYPGEDHR